MWKFLHVSRCRRLSNNEFINFNIIRLYLSNRIMTTVKMFTPLVQTFTVWCPHPVQPLCLYPQSAAQYSPCHSPCPCLCLPCPHTVAWVLGGPALSPLSCHCAPQCQIPSDKGLGPRPCCCFWPGKGEEIENGINLSAYKRHHWDQITGSTQHERQYFHYQPLLQSPADGYFCQSQKKTEHALTSLLISSCLSGAERAVALIMVDVWLSVSFLIQRCPATMLQT